MTAYFFDILMIVVSMISILFVIRSNRTASGNFVYSIADSFHKRIYWISCVGIVLGIASIIYKLLKINLEYNYVSIIILIVGIFKLIYEIFIAISVSGGYLYKRIILQDRNLHIGILYALLFVATGLFGLFF